MDNFINPLTKSWNVDFLNVYIHLEDVKIIRGLAISRNDRQDFYGWVFTESEKYTVKFGYRVESLFPVQDLVPYGLHIKPLLVFCWKLKCAPKLRHFIWQILSGTISVAKKLRARGIKCDTRCSICGAEEESIMLYLNAHQFCKHGLYQKSLQPLVFFPPLRCLLIWIIFSGDCKRIWF